MSRPFYNTPDQNRIEEYANFQNGGWEFIQAMRMQHELSQARMRYEFRMGGGIEVARAGNGEINTFVLQNPDSPFQNGVGSGALSLGDLGGKEYNPLGVQSEFIIPNSGSPFQNGVGTGEFSVRSLGGKEHNPLGVQSEFIIPNPSSPFQNGVGTGEFSVRSLGGEKYNPAMRVQRETEYGRVAEGNYPMRESGYGFVHGVEEEYERRGGLGNEGFASSSTSSSSRSPFEIFDSGINGQENRGWGYQPSIEQRDGRHSSSTSSSSRSPFESFDSGINGQENRGWGYQSSIEQRDGRHGQEEFYGLQNTTSQYGNKRIIAESEGAIERDGGEGSWSGVWKSEPVLNPASTSSLVSGHQNVESSVAKGSWSSISNELRWEPVGGYDAYFTKDKIQEIIELEPKDLTHPLQLSRILNKAPNKGPNSTLKEIKEGWGRGNKIEPMLGNVIDKVGNKYPIRYKTGSQEISLIFNALSKLDDDGTLLSMFYDDINSIRGKWKEILWDATAQGTSIILNALSKIPGDGKVVQDFYDEARISTNWNQNFKNANVQNISNVLGALSKIQDDGKRVGEFYGEIGGLNGLKKIFPRVVDKDVDFLIISKIMSALNGIKDGGVSVKEFYNSTKQSYTKTEDKILSDYKDIIKDPKAFLLDLHGFSYDAAEIVIKPFLDEARDSQNPFYIECGRSSHSSLENVGKMADIVKGILKKEGFRTGGNYLGCFEIEKLSIAPSTSAKLGSGELVAHNSQMGKGG